MKNNSLKERCKIATQEDGDTFVGIKVDVDETIVYFPLGYEIAETDFEIRHDILNLLNILREFKDKEEGIIAADNNESSDMVEFPLNSYLEIISYYMENGYYMEYDTMYETRSRGKINWSRTVKKQRPFLQENYDGNFSPIYTQYVVRESSPNENTEILNINKHCVYESFKRLGWLFTSYVPPKPRGVFDKRRFLHVLYNKLANTFNDSEKKLFQSMISMIEKMDDYNNQKQYYFGTVNFEHIWEALINNAFGILNKEDFYPRAQWKLLNGIKPDLKYPLQPDTIMAHDEKIYVLDAKYYKYGYTLNPAHLPKSSDVNKQITYAEYVQNNKDVEVDNIYNAFLMPFNRNSKEFRDDEIFFNMGEVVGDWRTKKFKYEHIQGILVDMKFLMNNYMGNKDSRVLKLAKFIEDAYEENRNLNDSM